MSTETVRVRVTGLGAGWTTPVLGPEGEQVFERIAGSGTTIRHPRWKHHMAQRGEVVDVPVGELDRLAGVVEVVEDGTPLSSAAPSPWAALARWVNPKGGAPTAPGVDPTPAAPVARVEAAGGAQAPAEAGEPAQAAAEAQAGLFHKGGGWYIVPGQDEPVRMSKAEAAAWRPEGD